MDEGSSGNVLTRRLGPLPTWAWLAILTALGVAYWLYARNKSSSTAAAAQSASPDVVVVDQGTQPPAEPAPPTGEPIPVDPVNPHPIGSPPRKPVSVPPPVGKKPPVAPKPPYKKGPKPPVITGGRPPATPDAHQKHLMHLHHLHMEHLAHEKHLQATSG